MSCHKKCFASFCLRRVTNSFENVCAKHFWLWRQLGNTQLNSQFHVETVECRLTERIIHAVFQEVDFVLEDLEQVLWLGDLHDPDACENF